MSEYSPIREFLEFCAIAVFSVILNSYALSILWGWFVTPNTNLPPLSLASALGVTVMIRFLTLDIDPHRKSGKDYETEVEWADLRWRVLGRAIARPLLALGVGWIIRLFMSGVSNCFDYKLIAIFGPDSIEEPGPRSFISKKTMQL